MNTRLLKRIANLVVKRYKQLDMAYWFEPREGAGHCDTTACIAGWAVTLDAGTVMPRKAARLFRKSFGTPDHEGMLRGLDASWCSASGMRFEKRAARLLGLTPEESKRLFHAANWPEPFVKIYHSNIPGPGTKAYAKIVHDRIHHFIKTNGAE